MTRRLNLRPTAEADLSNIWDYTAERWSLEQPRVCASGMTALPCLLCDQPEIAQRFGPIVPPVRIHRDKSHIVLFTADGNSLDVIRLVHARSNWQALLAE